MTVDFFHIGMSTFTEPGDQVLILLPCERVGSVGDLLATALQRLGAHPIKHGVVRDISETLAVMDHEKVNGLVGIPTQVLALARYGKGLQLKNALLTTDHVKSGPGLQALDSLLGPLFAPPLAQAVRRELGPAVAREDAL